MAERILLSPGGASESTLAALLAQGEPSKVRIDYVDGPTPDSPVYVGVAPAGSAETAAVWTVRRLTYSGTNVSGIDVRRSIAWTSRTSPTPPWE